MQVYINKKQHYKCIIIIINLKDKIILVKHYTYVKTALCSFPGFQEKENIFRS